MCIHYSAIFAIYVLCMYCTYVLTRTEMGETKSKNIKTIKYYISVFNFKVLYKTLPLSKKLISVWSQKSGVRMPLFTFCTFYPSNNSFCICELKIKTKIYIIFYSLLQVLNNLLSVGYFVFWSIASTFDLALKLDLLFQGSQYLLYRIVQKNSTNSSGVKN